MKPRVEFIGYFDPEDGTEPFPQFNVWDNVLEGGTVGIETLKWKGIEIPTHPSFEDWKARNK